MSQPIPKEWMNETDRLGSVYRQGVSDFILFASGKDQTSTTCPCPCKKCRNGKRFAYDIVRKHLILYGIESTYRVWALHGENPYKDRMVNQVEKENSEAEGLGMENFVDVAYGVHEELADDLNEGDGSQVEDVEHPVVIEPDLGKRYHEYKKKAEEKLYPSCEAPVTTLSAIVDLHNLKKQYKWSGNSVTALLSLLKTWLPDGNTLPSKYPVMKAMLKDLGMKAECIDACENNCMLYWKTKADLTVCSQCQTPRYKVKEGKMGKKETKEARKVLRHFPLIPRLKRLYTIPWIAREMTWHDRATPSWNYMRHPIDSLQWKTCKDDWPDFAKEGRNVWLGIATDGFNPRGVQSTGYSCWPVYLVPYNLPPSLCMKSEFHMMSLLIPGPKAPSQNIDVFLQPLVEELQQLWEEGVAAYDMHKREHFTLRAMLVWGIHDFPAYGNLSGCVTHGYKACPICGDETPSMHLGNARKIVYTNYRMFLKSDHPFRQGKYLGLKTKELKPPPTRLKGEVIEKKLSRVHYVPGKVLKGTKRSTDNVDVVDNGDDEDDEDNEVTEAWYKRSILFYLKYWPKHTIRHVIDVMHTEKNVAEHLLNAILDKKGTKDTVQAREDLRKMGIHSGQWMQTDPITGRSVKPKAPFVLNKDEKLEFCKILKDLKLPSGFSSNLKNIVTLSPPGLLTMKSHDYHVIMCYLLPVLLQHAYPKHRDLRRAIHQISLFFNLLCSKVVIRHEIQAAKYMVAEALCVLEKYFPTSFFDISIHLMVHLADEGLICGPVYPRWMFPFERYV